MEILIAIIAAFAFTLSPLAVILKNHEACKPETKTKENDK